MCRMAHPLFCWGAGVERRQSRRPRDSRGDRAGRPGDSDGIAVYWTGVPWGDGDGGAEEMGGRFKVLWDLGENVIFVARILQ